MASIAIQREAGIETIPHVTPRDTTVMGLEGVLLGAHADGVRNILAVTGDPPHVGDYPGSRGVYEIDSIGLVQLLAGLNEGVDYVGKAIDRPTSFFIGVAVNPSADDLDLELERFERKVDAGAQFAMTQALFDLDGLERFLERLGGTSPIPLLAGVWPLRSHAMALRLHNEVPGISVPAARARCARATPAPRRRRVGSALRARARPRARRRPAAASASSTAVGTEIPGTSLCSRSAIAWERSGQTPARTGIGEVPPRRSRNRSSPPGRRAPASSRTARPPRASARSARTRGRGRRRTD